MSALHPLIRDDDATPQDALPEADEKPRFAQEQSGLARLLHLFGPEHNVPGAPPARVSAGVAAVWFEVLTVAHDFLSWGGPRRVAWVYPALLHEAVALAQALPTGAGGTPAATARKQAYTFLHQICSMMAVAGHGEQALRLFVQAATACEDATFALEYFGQGGCRGVAAAAATRAARARARRTTRAHTRTPRRCPPPPSCAPSRSAAAV